MWHLSKFSPSRFTTSSSTRGHCLYCPPSADPDAHLVLEAESWRQVAAATKCGLNMLQLLFALSNICTKDVLSEAEPHRSLRSNRLAWVDIWSSIENHIKCTFQFVNFDGCVVNLWSKRKSSCCGCQFDSCCCLKSSGPVMYTKCLVDSGMPISIAAQELLYPVPWTWSHEVMKSWSQSLFQRERFQASHIDLQERQQTAFLLSFCFETWKTLRLFTLCQILMPSISRVFPIAWCSNSATPAADSKDTSLGPKAKEATRKTRQNHATRNA